MQRLEPLSNLHNNREMFSILMQISFSARKEQCFSLRPVQKPGRHHFFLRLQAILRHQCQLLEEKVRASHTPLNDSKNKTL